MAHLATNRPRERRAWREGPTTEALAIDRWRFGRGLGFGPSERGIVKPGAFGGLVFDVPAPVAFDDKAISPEGIAVLCIEGPLEHHPGCWWASYDDIAAQVQCALAHDAVRALVLKVDSPGGVAAGMGQAHRAIRRMREESGKLVLGWVDEQACSAAYNIVSACSEIWMPREAVVGSVGVIACTIDETAALEKAGVAVRYAVSGKRKADLHFGAPVTDEVFAVVQRHVNETAGHFFRAVARARGTTPEAIEGLEAAVFGGKQAVAVGLADGVADWPEFLGTLRGALGATFATTRGTAGSNPSPPAPL